MRSRCGEDEDVARLRKETRKMPLKKRTKSYYEFKERLHSKLKMLYN